MVPGISFETASLILSDVPEDKVFVSHEGDIFSSLEELAEGIKKMDSSTFEYHVNSEKNDFSTWIYDVVGDARLANNLRKSHDKKDFVKKIKTRMTYLKKNKKGRS